MAANQMAIEGAPQSVQVGVERFCDDLQQALGDQLVSIALYGGLARGEYAATTSDVNIMVVLRDVSIGLLDRIAESVEQGRRVFRLAVLVLSEEDLRRSTDVFPVKFLDMQRRHRILYGRDVFADLTVSREHLRLRCEQELKNLFPLLPTLS